MTRPPVPFERLPDCPRCKTAPPRPYQTDHNDWQCPACRSVHFRQTEMGQMTVQYSIPGTAIRAFATRMTAARGDLSVVIRLLSELREKPELTLVANAEEVRRSLEGMMINLPRPAGVCIEPYDDSGAIQVSGKTLTVSSPRVDQSCPHWLTSDVCPDDIAPFTIVRRIFLVLESAPIHPITSILGIPESYPRKEPVILLFTRVPSLPSPFTGWRDVNDATGAPPTQLLIRLSDLYEPAPIR